MTKRGPDCRVRNGGATTRHSRTGPATRNSVCLGSCRLPGPEARSMVIELSAGILAAGPDQQWYSACADHVNLALRIRRERAVTKINQHPEVLLYPRIRKSPYFYASRRHGVQRCGFYNHMYHPRHYGDPVEEYWQLLNGVTLWDVGVERQVEITGPDAFTLANMLVPRDLNKCAVGSASTSSLLRRTVGSSTIPCCADSVRITSGSRSPTVTCSCGRWASPTTLALT